MPAPTPRRRRGSARPAPPAAGRRSRQRPGRPRPARRRRAGPADQGRLSLEGIAALAVQAQQSGHRADLCRAQGWKRADGGQRGRAMQACMGRPSASPRRGTGPPGCPRPREAGAAWRSSTCTASPAAPAPAPRARRRGRRRRRAPRAAPASRRRPARRRRGVKRGAKRATVISRLPPKPGAVLDLEAGGVQARRAARAPRSRWRPSRRAQPGAPAAFSTPRRPTWPGCAPARSRRGRTRRPAATSSRQHSGDVAQRQQQPHPAAVEVEQVQVRRQRRPGRDQVGGQRRQRRARHARGPGRRAAAGASRSRRRRAASQRCGSARQASQVARKLWPRPKPVSSTTKRARPRPARGQAVAAQEHMPRLAQRAGAGVVDVVEVGERGAPSAVELDARPARSAAARLHAARAREPVEQASRAGAEAAVVEHGGAHRWRARRAAARRCAALSMACGQRLHVDLDREHRLRAARAAG